MKSKKKVENAKSPRPKAGARSIRQELPICLRTSHFANAEHFKKPAALPSYARAEQYKSAVLFRRMDISLGTAGERTGPTKRSS